MAGSGNKTNKYGGGREMGASADVFTAVGVTTTYRHTGAESDLDARLDEVMSFTGSPPFHSSSSVT